MRLPTKRPRDPLSAATFLALGLAVALLAVLAWQARVESTAHRRRVERALTEYAHFAAWQLSTQVRAELERLASAVLAKPHLLSALGGDPVPDLEAFAAGIREEAADCGCIEPAGLYFRLLLADSSLSTLGAARLDSAGRAWLRDTLLVAAASAARGPLSSTPGSPGREIRVHTGESRDTSRRPAIITQTARTPPSFLSGSIEGGREGGREVTLVFDVIGREDGGEAIMGFAADPESVFRAAIERVLGQGRLLPPSVARNLPLDSLLSIRVSAADGDLVFERPSVGGRFAATDSLGPRHGNLHFTVALLSGAAERMLVGAMPPSRLPLLLVLLGVTIVLAAVLSAHLRRQAALARLREEFVSGVSHELRTPLAQIRLLAELLAMGKPPTDEGRRQSARIIDQEARRLSHLVQNVLEFSRGTRRAPDLSPIPIDLATELEQVITTFMPLAAAEEVDIRAELQPGVSAMADPFALRQIMLNLLDNAVRYGGRERVVTVRAGMRDGMPCITVADEGPGVPEREQALVWEPYYRLEQHAGASRGGSGIGLAVVKELVCRQGGSVGVRNGIGGGAEFWFSLPPHRRDARAVEETATHVATGP